MIKLIRELLILLSISNILNIIKRTSLIKVITVLIFFLIVDFSFQITNAQNLPSNSGIIRVRFAPFPYVSDPYGGDFRSYGRLQEVSAYVLRVYPDSAMKVIRSTVEWSEELFGTGVIDKVNFIRTTKDYGKILVQTAKGLLKPSLCDDIQDLFSRGGPLAIFVDAGNLPPYIDIPAPAGIYYIEYSLFFNNAKNPKNRKVHPNYPSRSGTDNSLRWGPPRIIVYSKQMANIEFQSTNNINFYEYPDKGTWEDSRAFWDFIKYLLWSGEWY